MKQKQYAPLSVAEMALSIYAVNNGYFDKVDRKKVVDVEAALQRFAKIQPQGDDRRHQRRARAQEARSGAEGASAKTSSRTACSKAGVSRTDARHKRNSRQDLERQDRRRRSPRRCRWWRPARCVAPRTACAWRVRMPRRSARSSATCTQANPDYRHPFLLERERREERRRHRDLLGSRSRAAR